MFVLVFMFENDRKKNQPAGRDRSRNWSAENPPSLGVVLLTMAYAPSQTSAQSVPYKDKLPQRAALPLFEGMCPPRLYNRNFSKAQGIKMCCRSLSYNI